MRRDRKRVTIIFLICELVAIFLFAYFGIFQTRRISLDDTSVIAGEIKSNKSKSFLVATPKTIKYLLSKCNSKIEFINAPCKKRHNVFIEHNARVE